MTCPDCIDDQHLCMSHKLAYWRSDGQLRLDPRAMPSRRNSVAPATAQPNWEAGIVTEKRPGGTEMPMVDANTLQPIRVKHYEQHRTGYEAERRRLHNDPAESTRT